VLQSAQDWHGQNTADGLDGARYRNPYPRIGASRVCEPATTHSHEFRDAGLRREAESFMRGWRSQASDKIAVDQAAVYV
jgi:hypothetical protein